MSKTDLLLQGATLVVITVTSIYALIILPFRIERHMIESNLEVAIIFGMTYIFINIVYWYHFIFMMWRDWLRDVVSL